MSLTSHLRNSESPVRKFFDDRFPDIHALSVETRSKLRGASYIKPPQKAPYGTLGHAFELRARLFFIENNLKKAIPSHLAEDIPFSPLDWNLTYLIQVQALNKYKSEINRHLSGAGDPEFERQLIRYCFAFAWLEEIYRAGLAAWPHSPLNKEPPKSLKALLALPKPELVEDIRLMIDLFADKVTTLINGSVILDPKLKGAGSVGGADPDIIIGNDLVDFKTISTIKTDRFRRWVYQLIGYAFLDYNNKYSISGLAIYYARHGILIRWPFPEILKSLSEKRLPSMDALSKEFKSAVAKAK